MAQVEVSGSDILLAIDPALGTNWATIVCLTSNGINISTDTINSSSKCGTSSSPGTQTMDVPFEGNYMKNPDGTNISGADLFTSRNSAKLGQGELNRGYLASYERFV